MSSPGAQEGKKGPTSSLPAVDRDFLLLNHPCPPAPESLPNKPRGRNLIQGNVQSEQPLSAGDWSHGGDITRMTNEDTVGHQDSAAFGSNESKKRTTDTTLGSRKKPTYQHTGDDVPSGQVVEESYQAVTRMMPFDFGFPSIRNGPGTFFISAPDTSTAIPSTLPNNGVEASYKQVPLVSTNGVPPEGFSFPSLDSPNESADIPLRTSSPKPARVTPTLLESCTNDESGCDGADEIFPFEEYHTGGATEQGLVEEEDRESGQTISLGRCLPLSSTFAASPIASMTDTESISVPSLADLANFPQPAGRKAYKDGDTGTCIMCGRKCRCVRTRKGRNADDPPVILLYCRKVCTLCIGLRWELVENKVHLKWCTNCSNFKPLGGFREGGRLLTKCPTCRVRSRADSKKARKRRSVPTDASGRPVSTNQCVQLESLSLEVRSSTLVSADSAPVFKEVVNFPLFNQREKDGCKICVMCGVKVPFIRSHVASSKTFDLPSPCIRHDDKSVCSACQKPTWVLVDTKLQIKWCGSCRKFCEKAEFITEDGSASKTSCNSCRKSRQKSTALNKPRSKEDSTNLAIPSTNAETTNGATTRPPHLLGAPAPSMALPLFGLDDLIRVAGPLQLIPMAISRRHPRPPSIAKGGTSFSVGYPTADG